MTRREQVWGEDARKTTNEIERALLASLMLCGRETTWGKVSTLVRPTDIAAEAHRAIFEAIQAVAKESDPDLLLVRDHLQQTGRLERAGGAAYLASLVDLVPDVENVVAYAKKVRERAAARRAVAAG